MKCIRIYYDICIYMIIVIYYYYILWLYIYYDYYDYIYNDYCDIICYKHIILYIYIYVQYQCCLMSPVSSAMYVSVRLAEFASGLQPRIEPRVGKVSTVWQSDSVHGLLGKFVLELPKAAFPWNTLKSFFMAVEMHLRPAWRSPTSLHVQKWLKRAHCHTCHTIQNASKCQPCVQAGWAAHVLHICSCI